MSGLRLALELQQNADESKSEQPSGMFNFRTAEESNFASEPLLVTKREGHLIVAPLSFVSFLACAKRWEAE